MGNNIEEAAKMTLKDAITARHSVRSYESKPIPADMRREIEKTVARSNERSGLNIQVIWDCPEVFEGKIKGAENCIALIGKKSSDLDENIGYFGAEIMLVLQTLGLNSVWVAMSFNKKEALRRCALKDGEILLNALAFGYGATQGRSRKSKPADKISECKGEAPQWFKDGVEATLLAPTAINQQKFLIRYDGKDVTFKAKLGPYSKVDLGIVKYFFEIGSKDGREQYGVK